MRLSMLFYWRLQYFRIERWFREQGLHPLLGVLCAAVFFVALSVLLFQKTVIASWLYGFILLSILVTLGDKTRSDHLRNIFSKRQYAVLRLCENGLLSLPFVLFTLFQQEYIMANGYILTALAIAIVRIDVAWNRTIPTPFKKYPFEFITGFRKYLVLIILTYFLLLKAIQVDNFNLAAFTLVSVFLISVSFLTSPEHPYFVWIHSDCSRKFLKKKCIMAAVCGGILSIPHTVIIAFFFTDQWREIGLILSGGLLFLIAVVLAKYASYPKEMGVGQAFFLALCFVFPPFTLMAIWIFYKQSTKRLTPFLGC